MLINFCKQREQGKWASCSGKGEKGRSPVLCQEGPWGKVGARKKKKNVWLKGQTKEAGKGAGETGTDWMKKEERGYKSPLVG